VLLFNGTRVLEKANDVLREIVDRFPDHRIAVHARVALASPLTVDYKLVKPVDDERTEIDIAKAKPDEAASLIEPALVEKSNTAAETLGHIRYRTVAERLALRLAEKGADAEAAKTLDSAIDTLDKRSIRKPDVIEDLKETLEQVRGRRTPEVPA
jgi:hypothetical protein